MKDVLDREAWRGLSLTHVTVPTLDAPVLVFDDDNEGEAALLDANIVDFTSRYHSASTPKDKMKFALRIRRAHLRRVSLAIGVRVPGRPTVHGFIDG
jgi:hypothetical protein